MDMVSEKLCVTCGCCGNDISQFPQDFVIYWCSIESCLVECMKSCTESAFLQSSS